MTLYGSSCIGRHWRGALPLGVSIWLNGALVSVVLFLVARHLIAQDITASPRALSLAIAVVTFAILPVAVWQSVGIWRAAGAAMRSHRIRGLVARAVIAPAFLLAGAAHATNDVSRAWAYLLIALDLDPTPPHRLVLLDDGLELGIAGGIDFGTARAVRAQLDAHHGIRTVDLDSIGGHLGEAELISDDIHARHLATYVGARCLSACTIAYLGGDPRYLGPFGVLGFHRTRFPGLTAAEEDAINRHGRDRLIASGVTPAFAATAYATPPDRLWLPRAATLLAAGVVTRSVDGLDFAVEPDADLGQAAIGQVLATDSDTVRLKRRDPGAYTTLVFAIIAHARQGVSLRAAIQAARANIAR
jgi:hypothetical protein